MTQIHPGLKCIRPSYLLNSVNPITNTFILYSYNKKWHCSRVLMDAEDESQFVFEIWCSLLTIKSTWKLDIMFIFSTLIKWLFKIIQYTAYQAILNNKWKMIAWKWVWWESNAYEQCNWLFSSLHYRRKNDYYGHPNHGKPSK